MDKEDLHILRLMGEIDRSGDHSQRALSRRLGVSLGLVNTFLKRLVNKGYFKVMTLPKNRVKYLLTPEGMARKSKLTAEYLRDSITLYKDIKTLLLAKYQELEGEAVETMLFWGAGEVAELAYLYLQLTQIQLVGIVDHERIGKAFFGFKVEGVRGLIKKDWDRILLTRLNHIQEDMDELVKLGIDRDRMVNI
jgi:DNA-binding MarR family transcriptional regulator